MSAPSTPPTPDENPYSSPWQSIDHLLQAPEPEGPVAVTLVEVKGEYATPRPWTRYDFVYPELESLSSGQKLMVRMGVANERRLKARLAAFRERIATGAVATRR